MQLLFFNRNHFGRAGGADGMKGARPTSVSFHRSANRTGGFSASGFPRVVRSHRFHFRACVQSARVAASFTGAHLDSAAGMNREPSRNARKGKRSVMFVEREPPHPASESRWLSQPWPFREFCVFRGFNCGIQLSSTGSRTWKLWRCAHTFRGSFIFPAAASGGCEGRRTGSRP
jgi:hypothetical protein